MRAAQAGVLEPAGTIPSGLTEALGISVNTVSFHLKLIYEKLQVHSKTEAVAKALKERIV